MVFIMRYVRDFWLLVYPKYYLIYSGLFKTSSIGLSTYVEILVDVCACGMRAAH